MKLTFLGTGSAFTVGMKNYHSNLLLESDGKKKLLIDCGSDARFSLHEKGYSYKDITDIYISHLHADHAGGLEWLALTTKFDKKCKKPRLHVCEIMLPDLWKKTLSGGLSTLYKKNKKIALQDYFKVEAIKPNGFFEWEKIKFQIIQTIHIVNGFAFMPSFGLFATINHLNVFITTDTQFMPDHYEKFYLAADLIFHDCEVLERRTGVHANYIDLMKLPREIKAKMWLYHYNPVKLPNAKKDGFRGFVKKGQSFDFSHPFSLL